MGIKLGSVVEVVDDDTEIPRGAYTIDHLDPDDLHAPFRGTLVRDPATTVWFSAKGNVHSFEHLAVIVHE